MPGSFVTTAPIPSSDRDRPCVVVVEDDAALLSVLVEFLDDEGFRAIPVPRWHDALATIHREQPAAVVLDQYWGSQAAGQSLVDTLAAQPDTQHLPVILTTAARSVSEGGMMEQPTHHAVAVVHKPFELDELLDAVRAAVTATHGVAPSSS